MSIAIETNGLCKTYRPRRGSPITAVDKLTFQVPRGQLLGLLGPRGAGKTTLLKLLAGRLAPTTGQILLHGYDLMHEQSKAMRQIGIVLTGSWNMRWQHTSWESLLASGRLKGIAERNLICRATMLLGEANLWTLRNTPIQCQPRAIQIQLAIIDILLSDPAILLLDEPMRGLNWQEAQFLLSWVKRFTHEHGKTVVLATTHIDAIRKHCERAVVLDNGHLVADHPVSILDSLFPDQIYQIVLKGHLSDDWSDWFDGLTITHTTNEVTTLSGPLPDQAAFHGALIKVRDLGLPLLTVERVEPDVNEVLKVLTRDR